MAQALRFCRSAQHLILHRYCQRYSLWSDPLCQQCSNRLIQARTRNALTRALSLFNPFVLTEIIGHDALTPALMIAHGHAFSALPADDEPPVRAQALPVAEKNAGESRLDYSLPVVPRFSRSPPSSCTPREPPSPGQTTLTRVHR